MKLTMLGSGHAVVTRCYNTCYVIDSGGKKLLVDGGGGITVLKQLASAGIPWQSIHEIFVTHRHLDHITGILWLMRMYLSAMKSGRYTEDVYVYAHDEVTGILSEMVRLLLPETAGMVGKKMHFVTVSDGEERELAGVPATFFDIRSEKAKQFGVSLHTVEGNIVICGDEPLPEHCFRYAEGALWLLHEAFCLEADRERFRPREKKHSTVGDACMTAEKLKVRNLLLYHTEDSDMENRKAAYTAEGRQYYSGNLLVPDDLEEVILIP